jgi:hypothetical protein
MTPNELIEKHQTILKNQLSGLVQTRLIQSVEYDMDDPEGFVKVTINFMPEGSTIKAD